MTALQALPHLERAPQAIEILIGLAVGLLGWPIYFNLVRLAGFVVGAAIGVALAMLLDEVASLGNALPAVLIGAGIVGAILGFFLIRQLVLAVWFLMGMSLAVMVLWVYRNRLHGLPLEDWSSIATLGLWAAAALAGGLVTVLFRRLIVTGVTAAVGAGFIAPHLARFGPPEAVWWAAVTAGFFAVQYGLYRLLAGRGPDTAQ